MKNANRNSLISIGLIIFVLVLGCGGSRRECTGELTIDGRTHRGIDKDEALAKRNTCAKYCIEGNTEYDAMYRIWLESPRSKNVPVRENKWSALSDPPIKAFVEKCEAKCLQDAAGGKIKIDVACK